jgi:hypothetical protein
LERKDVLRWVWCAALKTPRFVDAVNIIASTIPLEVKGEDKVGEGKNTA